MALVEMTARAPGLPRMHHLLEASRAPAPQHLRLRRSFVRPLRLERHRPRGPTASRGFLAIRTPAPAGARGEPNARRRKNAPSPPHAYHYGRHGVARLVPLAA